MTPCPCPRGIGHPLPLSGSSGCSGVPWRLFRTQIVSLWLVLDSTAPTGSGPPALCALTPPLLMGIHLCPCSGSRVGLSLVTAHLPAAQARPFKLWALPFQASCPHLKAQ